MPLNRMARFQVKKQLVTIDFSIDFEKKPCSLKNNFSIDFSIEIRKYQSIDLSIGFSKESIGY